jgi:Flp pilus assembly protein TadD
MADALVATGRTEEAIVQLETGVREAPNDPSLLVGLGEALFKAGRFTEARTRLEAAAAKNPAGPWGRRAVELLKTFPK